MKYRVTLNDKTYEVEVEKGKAALSDAETAKTVEEMPREQKAPSPGGGESVKFPMPGQVVSVNAKVGDRVQKGQVLAVLEAMKMENDISAPRAGTVKRVSVSPGQSVSAGDELLALD